MASETGPVRICVIDDYDVIVHGTAMLLAPHADLVRVIDCTTDTGPDEPVDVALLDCFAVPSPGASKITSIVAHPNVAKVAVYSWGNAPELVEAALAYGASAYIGKGLSGRALAEALVATHRGERVVAVEEGVAEDSQADEREGGARRWPGVDVGLTERESEVLALITQGKRTAEIGEALYLSVNSIKTHTRNLFRKIGVSSRTEAALWGIDHGFRPDRSNPQP